MAAAKKIQVTDAQLIDALSATLGVSREELITLQFTKSDGQVFMGARRPQRVAKDSKRLVVRTDVIEARTTLHALEEKMGVERSVAHALNDASSDKSFKQVCKENNLSVEQGRELLRLWGAYRDVHAQYRADVKVRAQGK